MVRPAAHVSSEVRFQRDGLLRCNWLGRCICSGEASVLVRICLQGRNLAAEIIPAEEKSWLDNRDTIPLQKEVSTL